MTTKASQSVTRRRFTMIASAAATGSLLYRPYIARGARQFEGKELRLLTWSDDTGLAALRNIAGPFEEKTGVKVVADRTGSTSEMVAKLKAAEGQALYDVITLAGVGGIELANAGILEKPDPALLPNLANVPEAFRLGADGFAVGYYLWCDGLIYSTDTFDSPPKSYRQLWDASHDRRLFLPPPNFTEAMELTIIAAKMAGGDERNPDPGFQLLEELRDRVLVLGDNPNQIGELFRSGAVDIGGLYSPMFLPAFIKDPGYRVSATLDVEEGFYADLMFSVLPKHRPGDVEVAHAFVDFTLDPVVQGKMASDIWYGPINSAAVLSEETRKSPFIVTPELVQAKANTIDKNYLSTVRPDWIRRYTEIFGGA